MSFTWRTEFQPPLLTASFNYYKFPSTTGCVFEILRERAKEERSRAKTTDGTKMEGEYEKSASVKTPLIVDDREKQSLFNETRNNNGGFSKEQIVEEVKKQVWLAGPLVSVTLLQFSLQLIAIMFVGHLGKLPLSGASMATSFTSVTGISLLVSSASISSNFQFKHSNEDSNTDFSFGVSNLAVAS